VTPYFVVTLPLLLLAVIFCVYFSTVTPAYARFANSELLKIIGAGFFMGRLPFLLPISSI